MEEAAKLDICRLTINGKEYESFEITEETVGHVTEMIEWILDDIMGRWEERFEDCKGASYIAINLEMLIRQTMVGLVIGTLLQIYPYPSSRMHQTGHLP